VQFNYLEAYSAAIVYYLVIVSVLMLAQSRLERKFTWTSRRRVSVAAPVVPAIPHDAR
jgi:ABC-type arginine/histidine transport system permease subunit